MIETIGRSWWVILFSLVCYILYEQGLKTRNQDYERLSAHLIAIQQETKSARLLHERLTGQVNSQSDPAWVELTLMKELGLVPEGQLKVFFTPGNSAQQK